MFPKQSWDFSYQLPLSWEMVQHGPTAQLDARKIQEIQLKIHEFVESGKNLDGPIDACRHPECSAPEVKLNGLTSIGWTFSLI